MFFIVVIYVDSLHALIHAANFINNQSDPPLFLSTAYHQYHVWIPSYVFSHRFHQQINSMAFTTIPTPWNKSRSTGVPYLARHTYCHSYHQTCPALPAPIPTHHRLRHIPWRTNDAQVVMCWRIMNLVCFLFVTALFWNHQSTTISRENSSKPINGRLRDKLYTLPASGCQKHIVNANPKSSRMISLGN